jgi:hypothetical protein
MLEIAMTPVPHTDKSVEKSNEIPSIDSSLKELVTEAKALFKVLDSASNKIRELETSLRELKAHFPFRHRICEEKESPPKPPEEHHAAAYPCVQGYRTKVYWYLAWEHEEVSKNYRLCLVSEEKDIIAFYVDDSSCIEEVPSKILFRKPLIETDLSTRLRYSQHLLSFLDSFKVHIKSSRIWIEEGTDAIPF